MGLAGGMWACLETCPMREITSFVLDSSRSRKSVGKNRGLSPE